MEEYITMTFRPDVTLRSDRVQRAGKARGMAVGGGGIGILLLAGIMYFMGADPSQIADVLGGNQQTGAENQNSTLDHCKTGADANEHADCRVSATAESLDGVWEKVLPQQAGIKYVPPQARTLDGSAQTGCGMATSATGPFYCPGDQTAYFDVSFFEKLPQFGAKNTPFAQEYIVAHEFGHHIQKLQGTLHLSNYNEPGADSNAVKIELQADCYAGIWAHYADKGENAFLQPITQEELAGAINAARAVGDDNIQKRSGGTVRPDLFTHGTSEQRQQAFLNGYQSGQLSSCPL
ncbi:putative metalloprotease [Corynebacterium mustelae]|uniref:Putative metalloprotease n=2 Tax=Corynebacterium mustelae TaxID=571915 RepID=A0A0G3H4I7_9CORY|nr:putative metalloprotease [Corynebacterium mustelae]